jgi:alkylation response protein AidB-like acyl-CoA dehydrogenase
MPFFTDDQKDVLQSLRGDEAEYDDVISFLEGPLSTFLEEEVAPKTHEQDQEELFNHEAFTELGKLGTFGLSAPEDVGGMDLCHTFWIAALESIAKADAGLALAASIHVTTALGIHRYADPQLVDEYVPPLIRGDEMACFCLSETGSGSDARSMETTYRPDPDGDGYLLNGTKYWITNGLSADTYFVVAEHAEDPETHTAFLVRKGWDGTFQQHPIPDKMGVRSSETGELTFRDYRVPADHVIGEEGDGFRYAMEMLNGGRIGIAAWVTGIAQGALEKILKYASERDLFDRKLKDHDLARAEFSEMLQDVWSGRHLAYSAAYHHSEGHPIAKRAAIAKVAASEGAVSVCERAIEYGGGYGYVQDSRIERHLRDALLGQIGEGANELLKVNVIPGFLFEDFDPDQIPAPW